MPSRHCSLYVSKKPKDLIGKRQPPKLKKLPEIQQSLEFYCQCLGPEIVQKGKR